MILLQVMIFLVVLIPLTSSSSSDLKKDIIYYQDFLKDPGGWHYHRIYEPWNYSDQYSIMEWESDRRCIKSQSPWGLDGTHASHGTGYLQLVAFVWMNSLNGGIPQSTLDLTNAFLSFKIMAKDLDLKWGHLYFWFQHQYEHGLVGKRPKRSDYVLIESPIDILLTPNTWSEVTLPLRPISSAWACLVPFTSSQTKYGWAPIQNALQDVNVNFGFIILPVDFNNPASGIIRLKDICIYRLTPEVIPLASKGNKEKNRMLTNRDDKLSYSIGMEMGKHLKTLTKNLPSDTDVEINFDIFERAIDDAFFGKKTVLTKQQVRKMVPVFFMDHDQWPISIQKKLLEKKKEGEAFLAENEKREDIKILSNGLQYKIIKAGTGKKPNLIDTAVVHYRGTLVDGTEFESSYGRGEPVKFRVADTIPGWAEALQLMEEGAKWKLFIPPRLAFGEYGVPALNVGPNETLIYEMELISVQ